MQAAATRALKSAIPARMSVSINKWAAPLATKDAACRWVSSEVPCDGKILPDPNEVAAAHVKRTREFLERVAAFYPRSIFLDLFEPTRRYANFIVPMFDLRQSKRLRLIRM